MVRSPVFLLLACLAVAATARPASAQTALAVPAEEPPASPGEEQPPPWPGEAVSARARTLFAFDFAGGAPEAAGGQAPAAPTVLSVERVAFDE